MGGPFSVELGDLVATVGGPIVLVALALFLWWASKRARPSSDIELNIVLLASTRCAIVEGAPYVTRVHFARMALLSPFVSGALDDPKAQESATAVIPAGETSEPQRSSELTDVLREAARLHREGKATTPLHGALLILKSGADETARRVLQHVDLDKAGALLAAGVDDDLDGSEVFLVNDHTTKMEEVVALLETHMGFDHMRATYVMLTVHQRGFAVLGKGGDLLERLRAGATDAGLPNLQITDQAPA